MIKLIYTLSLALFCLACKQDKNTEIVKEDVPIVKDKTDEQTDTSNGNWLYVNAENGLNIRDENGEILGKYPNGTPVNIVDFTEDIIEVVDGNKTIKGRKAIIDFYDGSGKEVGYLFEGYLSSINVVKIYNSELCKYIEYVKGSGSSFSEPRCLQEVFKLELMPANYETEFLDKKQDIINEDAFETVNNIMELPIKKGSLKIESFPATDDYGKQEVYSYIGELPLINSYLIFGEFYEHSEYFIYDKDTGKVAETLQSVPIFSPNGKKMIALGYNHYEASGEFEIASVVNSKLTNKRYFSFVNWAIVEGSSVSWIDDNTFVLNVVHSNAYYDQEKQVYNKNETLLKVTIL